MIVYGKQVVLYILENHSNIVEEVLLSKEIDKKLFSRFAKLEKKIIKVDNKKAQSIAQGGNHQGFFLKLNEFTYSSISNMKKSNFIIILDGLSDVGNIGAITRSAYALGADGIIASGVRSLNEAGILRTSSGALLDMAFSLYPNSLDLANELKQCGFTLIGATMNGTNLKEFTKNNNSHEKIALFLGSEGFGLSKKIEGKLDLEVSIPMQNDFNSLNVSVAASILIYALKG